MEEDGGMDGFGGRRRQRRGTGSETEVEEELGGGNGRAVRVQGEKAEEKRWRLLLGVANVGGSLTVLLQIALVAWGVRQLRSMLARRNRPRFAMLTPVAVRRLVELDPLQYFFVDVRQPPSTSDDDAAAAGGADAGNQGFSDVPFEAVLRIPDSELKASLRLSEAEWKSRFPSASKPSQRDLIIFLSTKGERAKRAATVAADLGYSGCCVLAGGIEAYEAAMSSYVDVPLKFLSRDAVAALMEKHENVGGSAGSGSGSLHLLDVRRHDERSLFGHIRGSQNIPVVELPKALNLDKAAWEKTYHFPKFADDDTVIFQCRINGRAAWAAQLAQDAGLKQCFVYKDGVCGWRLDPTVLPHDAFKLGDTPPDPINFEVQKVDYEAAREELQQLGLL